MKTKIQKLTFKIRYYCYLPIVILIVKILQRRGWSDEQIRDKFQSTINDFYNNL